MKIIGSIAQYVSTRGRLLYADWVESGSLRASRGRGRRNAARSKYLEMMEPRVLMTTIVGGQTFKYTDAHGNPVTVTLSGNAIAEIVAVRQDGNDTAGSFGGGIFGDLTGQYDDGTWAGNGSVFPDNSTQAANATINIPNIPYPTGVNSGKHINLSGIASAPTGKTYVFNLYSVNANGTPTLSATDTRQSIWTMQVIELSNSGGTNTVVLTLTGDDAQSLLPVGVNSATQTQSKLYTDVTIPGAAFNPIDGKLYFDLHYKLENNTTISSGPGTNSTTTSTDVTTYADELFSFTVGTNQFVDVGPIALDRATDGTPNFEVRGLTFTLGGTDATMYVALQPTSSGSGGGGGGGAGTVTRVPELSSYAVAANGAVTPGTALNTVELGENILVTDVQGNSTRDQLFGITGLASLPASDVNGGSNFIFADVNIGTGSHLTRIDVTTGVGVNWGDTNDLYVRNPNNTANVQRGQSPVGLTYNPVAIDPFTGRAGTFMFMDTGNRYLLLYLNHEFRVSRGDAFAVYSNTSDINSLISFQGRQLYTGAPAGTANTGTVFLGYNGEFVEGSSSGFFRSSTIRGSVTQASSGVLSHGVGVLPGVFQSATQPGLFTSTIVPGVNFASNMESAFIPGTDLVNQMLGNSFINVRGLAVSPSGVIAAISSDGFHRGDQLGLINRATGQLTVVHPVTSTGNPLTNVQALAYGDPTLTGNAALYAVYDVNGRPTLGTINTSTGAFTALSNSIFPANTHGRVYAMMFTAGGTAGNPSQQTLYVIADPNAEDGDPGQYLYRVNPTTGAIFNNAPTFDSHGLVTSSNGIGLVANNLTGDPLNVGAAMFDVTGRAIVLDRTSGRLMDVNIATGAAGAFFTSDPGFVNATLGGIALDPLTLTILGIDNDASFQPDNRLQDVPNQTVNTSIYTSRMVRIADIGKHNTAQANIGAFLFDGAMNGPINVTGSIGTIYAGLINQSITVSGDLQNLLSIGNISGSIDVGGKIGQIYSLGTISSVIHASNINSSGSVLSSNSFSGSFESSLDAYAYNFRGSATGTSGIVRLTDGRPNEAGSVFLNSVSAFDTFTASFEVEPFGTQDGGFAFVLQNQGPNPLGGSGTGLGYSGILNSAALEFNYDPATGGSSMGFRTNGQIGYSPIPLDITTSGPFTVDLRYDGTTLFVSLNGGVYTTSFLTNLASIIGNRGAYVGFTASSGALGSETDILDFSYVGVNNTSPATGVQRDVNTIGFLGTELVLDNQTQTRFSNYSFATAQYLGTMGNPVSGQGDLVHLQADGSWSGTNNVFYAVPLLAGQPVDITVGPINASSSTLQHFRILDPTGSEVANDYSFVSSAQTNSRTVRLTPDMPGDFRIEIYSPDNSGLGIYDLTVRGMGNVAIGGVVAVRSIALPSGGQAISADTGDIGALVGNARGGLGQIYAAGDSGITNTGLQSTGYEFGGTPTSDVYVPNGNLRAMVALNISSWNTPLGQTPFASDTPDINVNGIVGLLMTVNSTVNSNILAVTMGHASTGQIQMVSAATELGGYYRTNKSIGVIRAGSISNDVGGGFVDTEFHADVDRVGNDGFIDLIDDTGDWGINGAGPPIVTGPGGNVGFMRVGGLLWQDPAFSTGGSGGPTTHTAGQVVSYTDDSGALVTMTPGTFLTVNGTTVTTSQGQILTDTYGVRGAGGVVILAVTCNASMTITVAAGGSGLSAEIGTITVDGTGPNNTVVNGVPALGNSSTNAMNDLTISSTNGGRLDVFDVRSELVVSGASTLGGIINHLTNTTDGDIYSVHARSLGVITTKGNIGVQNLPNHSGAARLPVDTFSTVSVFSRQFVGILANGSANSSTSGVGSIVQISSARGIGAILANGIIGTLTADSDNVDDPTVFEGLTSPIVVQGIIPSTSNTTTSSNQISINTVNIGEGIAPSMNLETGFVSGIYAVGTIWTVNGNHGDIMGNVLSERHIGTVSLSSSSIIGGSVLVFDDPAMASVLYGNVSALSTFGNAVTLTDFSTSIERPDYNIDSVNISGSGGGIIGSTIWGASTNNITVGAQGFGIIGSLIRGVGSGVINSISAGGYGLRAVNINNARVNSITATGSGAALPISNFSSRVRNSEHGLFNPYFNQLNNALNDLPTYLLGDGVVEPADDEGLASGVIHRVQASGQESVGNISAYNISDSLFTFPSSTGAISVRHNVRDVQIITGRITSINVGNDASVFEVTAAGTIGSVFIGGSFLTGTDTAVTTLSQILAKGPSGNIQSATVRGSFGGLISANGKIGSFTVGTPGTSTAASAGDFFGSITIGGNHLTGSVLDLFKVYGSLTNGLIQIVGNVNTIDVAHDFSMPEAVVINGSLTTLNVGTDTIVNGSVISSPLHIAGSLTNATITGIVTGTIIVQGGITKLAINSDAATTNGILLPGDINVAGTITSASIQGSVTGHLLGGVIGSLTISGALLGGILGGKSISSATITGGMLAGSTISSALGDISKLAITGNMNGSIVAVNGALGSLTLTGTGNIGANGSINVRTIGTLTVPGGISGTVNASLSISTLKAGSVTSTAYISTGAFASITTVGDLNGTLIVGSSTTPVKLLVTGTYGAVGSFGSPLSATISGNMAVGSAILSTSNLTSLAVKGSIFGQIVVDRAIGTITAASVSGAIITSGLAITSLTVPGAITNTFVQTGLARGIDLIFGTSDLGEQARMADIGTLSTGKLVNSLILAGGNITTLKISQNMSSSNLATGLVVSGTSLANLLADATPLADLTEIHTALQGSTLLRGGIKTATIGTTGTTVFNSAVVAGVSPGADGTFGTVDDNVNTSLTGGTSAISSLKGLIDGTSRLIADASGASAATVGYTLDNNPATSIIPNDPVGTLTVTATPGNNKIITTASGTITISITGPAGASVAIYDNATTTNVLDTLVISGPTNSGVTVTVTTTSPGTFDLGRVLTTDDTQVANFTFNGDIVGDGTKGPALWIDSNMTSFTVRNLPNDAAWNGSIGGDVSKLTINQLGPGRLRIGGRVATLTVNTSVGNPMLEQLGTVTPATFLTGIAYDPGTDSTVATDGSNLLSVNPTSGSITNTVPILMLNGSQATISGLTYGLGGQLYGVGQFNNLNPISHVGQITVDGDTLHGLAINSLGQIYAIDSQDGTDRLVTLDASTGALTVVGLIRDVASNTFSNNFMALTFDQNDNLLALVSDRDGTGAQFAPANGVGLGKLTVTGGIVRISNPTAIGLPVLQAAPNSVFTAMGTDPVSGTVYAVRRVGSSDELDTLAVTGTGVGAAVTRSVVGTIRLDSAVTDTNLVGIGVDENGKLTGLNTVGTSSELIAINTTSPAASSRLTLPSILPTAYNAYALGKSGTAFKAFAYTTNNTTGGFLYTNPGVSSALGTVGTDGTFVQMLPLSSDTSGTALAGHILSIAGDGAGHAFVVTDQGQLAEYNLSDGSLVGNAPLGTIKDSLGATVNVTGIAFNASGILIGLNPEKDNLVQVATTSTLQAGGPALLALTLTEPGTAPHSNLSTLSFNSSTGQFISYSAASGNFVNILGTSAGQLGGLVANSYGTISLPDAFTSRIAATGNGATNSIDSIKFIGVGTFTGAISSVGGIGAVTGTGLTFAGFLVGHGDLNSFVMTGAVAEPGVLSIDGRINTATFNGSFDGALVASSATTLNFNGAILQDATIEVANDVTTLNVTQAFGGMANVGAVKTLKITGALASGSTFTVLGDAGVVSIGGSQLGSLFLVNQTTTSITVTGTLAGVIATRRSVTTVTLATVTSGLLDIGGDITNLNANGNVANSLLSVGTWIGADHIYNTADDVIFGGSILNAKIAGQFSDSLIAAGILPREGVIAGFNNIPSTFLPYTYNPNALSTLDVDSAEGGGVAPSYILNIAFSKPVISTFTAQGMFAGIAAADGIGKVTASGPLTQIVRNDPPGAPEIGTIFDPIAGTTSEDISFFTSSELRIAFNKRIDSATLNADTISVINDLTGQPVTDLRFGYFIRTNADGSTQGVLQIFSPSSFNASGSITVVLKGGLTSPTIADRTGFRSSLLDYNQDGVLDVGGDPFGTTLVDRSVHIGPPVNDAFVNAIEIFQGTTTAGDTTDATRETGEPNHDNLSIGKSLWYKWVATFDGTVTVDTNGSNFDTVLAVYTGTTVQTLTQVNADDDSGDGLDSRLQFVAVNGTTYYIAVDGYDYGTVTDTSSFGEFLLTIT